MISNSDWTLLVQASVSSVLSARDDAKQFKDRSRADLVPNSGPALALRASGPPSRLELISQVREHVVMSDAGKALFDAALVHGQRTPNPKAVPGATCALTGITSVKKVVQLELFCNVHPTTGTPGRHDSTHTVHKKWIPFVDALGVVGALHAWLDEAVKKLLPPAMDVFTGDINELASKLRMHYRAYHVRCEYLNAAIVE